MKMVYIKKRAIVSLLWIPLHGNYSTTKRIILDIACNFYSAKYDLGPDGECGL
jgi:hypothetical protein